MPNLEAAAAADAIISFLEHDGLIVERDGSSLQVSSPDGTFVFAPVVHLPLDLLDRYLDQFEAPSWGGDPRDEALSLLKINLIEDLTTDHGEGRNYTRAVGLRRGRGGRVELFVEQDVPPVPDLPPDPDLRWEAPRPADG